MILNLFRIHKKRNYTVGKMFVDGKYFCDTLELPEVVGGQEPMTAIPSGNYECGIVYSPKFKRNLIEVKRVPGRSDIRIHAGNTVEDTEGCPLVGKNTAIGRLSSARKYEEELTSMVEEALSGGDKVVLSMG